MAGISNILFDMDGVLIDSEACIRTACIRMLAEEGITARPEDFIPFTGMGELRFIGGVAEKYGAAYRPGMKERAYEIYGEIAAEMVVVYDGVRELILSLKEQGYGLAVASAADLVKVQINLRCMGLSAGDFGTVVTGSDVTRHKPFPDVFLTAAQRIGADPARTLVVEDAVSGCRAAVAAGMRCVGVTTTFPARQLEEAGAAYTIPATAQLPGLLPRFD